MQPEPASSATSFVRHGDICHSRGPTALHVSPGGYVVCENGVSKGVFDALPDRFTATELYKAAKLESTHAMQRRTLIASVLVDAFKCISIKSDGGRGRHWKKPGATHDKR